MVHDLMSDQHKRNPVTFRPPEEDRVWLYAHAETSDRSIGSVLSEALARYRTETEAVSGVPASHPVPAPR